MPTNPLFPRRKRIAALFTIGRYGKAPRERKPRRPRPGAVMDKAAAKPTGDPPAGKPAPLSSVPLWVTGCAKPSTQPRKKTFEDLVAESEGDK